MEDRINDNDGTASHIRSGFIQTYEIIFTVLLTGLAFFHILIQPFQFVLDMKYIKSFEPKAALAAAAAAAFYVIISCLYDPDNLKRIKAKAACLLSYEQVFMLFIAVWFAVSIQINKKYTGENENLSNRWEFCNAVINALIIFPLAGSLSKGKAKKVIEGMLMAVLGLYSLFSIYGLWQVCHLNFVRLPSGNLIMIINDPMALRLGNHYNLTGFYGLTMLLFCLYFMSGPKKWFRIISIPMFFIHLFVCNLSNSRTIYVTGLMVLPLYLFVSVWNRSGRKSTQLRICLSLIAAGIGFCFYHYSRPAAFVLFEKLSHYSRTMPESIQAAENIRALENNLNGRREIWIYSLKTMFHDPSTFLFGVTPAHITKALISLSGFSREVSHAHNAVLQIGVSLGFPAMIAYIVFLCRICLKTLRILLFGLKNSVRSLSVIPVIVFGIMVPNLVEPYIVQYQGLCSFFFLIAGCIPLLTKVIEQNGIRDKNESLLNERKTDPV